MEDFDELIRQADFQRINYSRPASGSRTFNQLTYTISGVTVTGTSPKYVEFDVNVSDILGTKYLDQSAVRIKYPNTVFGTYIVTNNKIFVTRGTLNADTSCYGNVIPTDRSANTILIPAFEKTYSQCKKKVLTTPQSIMHIKIEIANCNLIDNISIADSFYSFLGLYEMALYSAYAEFPSDTFQTDYDAITAIDSKPIPACYAEISDFYPKTLNGGVGDILTITRRKFGTSRGAGNIYFYDANNPSTGINLPLDSRDYILWSDTMIKVYVPSLDTGSNKQPIGTGKFRIETDTLEKDTSDSKLNIYYSLMNITESDTSTKKRLYLQNFSGNGGYKFYIDTSVWNRPDIMNVVRKSISEWVCATGVNFSIAKVTFGLPRASANDGINLITFGYRSQVYSHQR